MRRRDGSTRSPAPAITARARTASALHTWPLCWFVALGTGCFVDATGEAQASGGQAGATQASTGGGAQGGQAMTGGAPATGGDGGGGSPPTDGGAGGAGAGGVGGSGGGCDNGVLKLDGDDEASLPQKAQYDFANDFSFGLRVKPGLDPKFAETGLAASQLIRKIQGMKGYALALVEGPADDGMMFAEASVWIGNSTLCQVRHPVAVSVGEWHELVVTFKDDSNIADLSIYVDGDRSSAECGGVGMKHPTSVSLGSWPVDGTRHFLGVMDDLFFAKQTAPVVPADCGNTNVVALFKFEDSLENECAEPVVSVKLGADAAAPTLTCE